MNASIVGRFGARMAVGLLALLAGCRSAEQPHAAVTFALEKDVASLDPTKVQDPFSFRLLGQIYEGLVTLDTDAVVRPALADSWTHSPGFDVWTFHVRPNVFFHRDSAFGERLTRRVTAEDVVRSYTRFLAKDSYPAFVLSDIVLGASDFQDGKAQGVAGLRAIDSATVEIRLRVGDAWFLGRLTSPWLGIYPPEVVALGADLFGRGRTVGTGPFRVVSFAANEVVLERNADYWRVVPGNLERVVFRVVGNPQLVLSQLQSGAVDIAPVSPGMAASVLVPGPRGPQVRGSDSASLAVGVFPTLNSHILGFNSERLDRSLRRAISYAIDRSELVRAVTGGTAAVAAGTVPAGLGGYVPPFPGDIFDTVRARAELRASPHRSADSIELLIHDGAGIPEAAQLLQAQLGRLGVAVKLRSLDYNVVIDRMVKGDAAAFLVSFEYVFSAPEPILANLFTSTKIPAPNFWRYRSAAVDSSLNILRGVADPTRANALAQTIERQVIEDAPAAFLYRASAVLLYRRGLTGLGVNAHSIPLLWNVRLNGRE